MCILVLLVISTVITTLTESRVPDLVLFLHASFIHSHGVPVGSTLSSIYDVLVPLSLLEKENRGTLFYSFIHL